MKNTIVGIMIGFVIGATFGYFASDVTAYSRTTALRREAFTGGLISMCVSMQNEHDMQIFTVDQCDQMAQDSIANNYFERWDAIPTATPQR